MEDLCVNVRMRPNSFERSLFKGEVFCYVLDNKTRLLKSVSCARCELSNKPTCFKTVNSLMEHYNMIPVDKPNKNELCDEEEEATDAVGAIERVTRDSVPVASSTRNESIWYKLFRKPFKKNIKNET